MLSRASVGRNAARALRYGSQSVNKRGMAAAAPKGFEYETSEAAGVKVASRDIAGPTTTLTVVAKGGSRYQPFPGYSDVLEKFAFKVGVQWIIQVGLLGYMDSDINGLLVYVK